MRRIGAYIEGMNTLFVCIFIICAFCILCHFPNDFLGALIAGGSKAAATCVALVATYSVWMGLMKVWEKSGLAKKAARLIAPLAKKILDTDDEKAVESASMNFAVNLLGISGAGTPYGVTTANLLDKTENAEYSSAMFFVINASSLQLFPASIVAMRMAMGSSNPTDIVLPTLLTTLFSTALAIILTRVFLKPKREKLAPTPDFIPKTKGVCTR